MTLDERIADLESRVAAAPQLPKDVIQEITRDEIARLFRIARRRGKASKIGKKFAYLRALERILKQQLLAIVP